MYYPLIFYYSKNVIHSLHFVKLREKLYENKNVYVHINFFNIYTFILTYKTLIVIRRKKNRLLTSRLIFIRRKKLKTDRTNTRNDGAQFSFIPTTFGYSLRENPDPVTLLLSAFVSFAFISALTWLPISIHAFALPFPLKKRTL